MKRIGITFSPKIDEGKGKNTEARRGKSRAFGTDQSVVYLVVGFALGQRNRMQQPGRETVGLGRR